MELRKEKIARIYPDEEQHSDVLWERSKITGALKLGCSKVFHEDDEPWKNNILDPNSDIVLQWKRVFMFSSLVALIIDPFFLYLPVLVGQGNSSCVKMDLNFKIVVTYFRTITDLFYLLHVLIKFRTAYTAPTARGFGRGELVMDSKRIARRYLQKGFFIDLVAALPIPQVVFWFIIPALRTSHTDHTNNALLLSVLVQYIPRLYQIFPMGSEIIKATGVFTKAAWVGAVYNLLLYMIASHVVGASWYLLSIERYTVCWKSECRNEVVPLKCSLSYLDCKSLQNTNRAVWANSTLVYNKCDATNSNITFNYGMFQSLLGYNILSSSVPTKYFFCFWFGLQTLSCFGQTAITSTFIEETSFCIIVTLAGLILFAHLIGNVQTYLASITARLEEWRLKQRDTEEWMRHRQLPQDLQDRVRNFIHYKWLATRGVDEEAILHALPTDIRRDIKRHLCLDLVRQVPFFSQMDDQLLDAICECLVSSLSTKATYIVREGDIVTEMLFIIKGRLESSTTNRGSTGFFNSITLRSGDFCGEELLEWALLNKSILNLPISTRTVRALSSVEAFALQAADLKFVANQFRCLHSKKLQHTFRFYSHHWRTWAACFIQAAWRQYKRRMMAKALFMPRSLSFLHPLHKQAAIATGQLEDFSVSKCCSILEKNLRVSMLASRFATKLRMEAQMIEGIEIPLQKPEEPKYFITESDDDYRGV